MKPFEFQQHALHFARDTEPKDQLLHGAVGLIAELAEYARSRTVDELGDCWFFWMLVFTAVEGLGALPKSIASGATADVPPNELCRHAVELARACRPVLEREAMTCAAELCGAAEKVFFQHHEISSERAWYIGQQLVRIGSYLIHDRGIPPEKAWTTNHEKLHRRYPEGEFDADRSRSRNEFESIILGEPGKPSRNAIVHAMYELKLRDMGFDSGSSEFSKPKLESERKVAARLKRDLREMYGATKPSIEAREEIERMTVDELRSFVERWEALI